MTSSSNGKHYRSFSSSSSFAEPIINSSNPNIYSGHLEPSYKRFTNYDPIVKSSQLTNSLANHPISKSSSNSILTNLIESRKANSSKLKGLIIPERAQVASPTVTDHLPTIVSSKTVELLSSTDSSSISSANSSPLSRQGSCSSNGSGGSVGTNSVGNHSVGTTSRTPSPTKKIQYTNVTSSLYEPPFATLKNTIPKYSPAFKTSP